MKRLTIVLCLAFFSSCWPLIAMEAQINANAAIFTVDKGRALWKLKLFRCVEKANRQYLGERFAEADIQVGGQDAPRLYALHVNAPCGSPGYQYVYRYVDAYIQYLSDPQAVNTHSGNITCIGSSADEDVFTLQAVDIYK